MTEDLIMSWLASPAVPKPSNGIEAPLFSCVVVAMALGSSGSSSSVSLEEITCSTVI